MTSITLRLKRNARYCIEALWLRDSHRLLTETDQNLLQTYSELNSLKTKTLPILLLLAHAHWEP